MEEIKSNSILNFNENHLRNVRNDFGYDNVNKLKHDIEHLRDWIQKQRHFRVKEFDEEFLERFLIYSKGSIERAKQKLDRLCTCTNLMPDFLQNFDIRNEFRHLFKVSHTCVLPKPTDDNYRIMITQVTGDEANEFNLIQYCRYLITLGHYVLRHDYCKGYEMIGDSRNITFNTITKLNPVITHRALTLLIGAMGLGIKKIHLISGSKFFDTLLMLVKQGLSAKLRERIVVHSNVESLYKYIPRERLPRDFGGDENTIKELSNDVFKELSSEDHIAKVKFMEKAATDESFRLPIKFNEEYSGTPGSFKALCVD